MKQMVRVGIALVAALGLVGCGGRPLAPGKEAAAGALFQSSRGTQGTPGMLAQLMNAGAGTQAEIKVSCPNGGTVAIKIDVETMGTNIAYDLTYDGCNFDGHTSMKGTLHMTFDILSSGTQVQLALHLKGKIELWGEISDFIDVDVTETVTQSDLSSGGATVELVLNGTIIDSSGTYAFANERVFVDGSGFTPAPDPNQG